MPKATESGREAAFKSRQPAQDLCPGCRSLLISVHNSYYVIGRSDVFIHSYKCLDKALGAAIHRSKASWLFVLLFGWVTWHNMAETFYLK